MFTILGLAAIFGGSAFGIFKMILQSLPEEEPDYGEFPRAMLPGSMLRMTNRLGSGLDPDEQRDTINRLVMRIGDLEEQLGAVNSPPALPPAIPVNPSESVSSPVNSPVHPTSSPPDSPPVHPTVHLPSSPDSPPSSPSDSPFEDPAKIQELRHLILLNYSKSEALMEVFGIDTKRDKSGNPNSKYQKASKLFEQLKQECEHSLTLEYRKQLENQVNGNQII
jgi:hypothetical protein